MHPSLPPLTKLLPLGCQANDSALPSTLGSARVNTAPASPLLTLNSLMLPSAHAAASCVLTSCCCCCCPPLLLVVLVGAALKAHTAPPEESVDAIGCSCAIESSWIWPLSVAANRRQWGSSAARAQAKLLISLPSAPGMVCASECAERCQL